MDITIPKNVRQMGEPEEKRKIYVEDYVVTYLKQYAKEEILNSRGAILLGRAYEQEGIPYLFIRSALELKEQAGEDGSIAFTNELWMQIYEDMDKYFQGQEILGWFLSTPGFPPEISYEILNSHRNHFSGSDKVLFIEDPTEGEEAFFAMEQGSLMRQKGYFIFYERNEPMQQYMLEKRGGKSVDAKEDFTDRAARSFRTIVQERKEQSSQRRVITFLYGISTFLVMVVLVIGITMINNYEKMEQVELALTNLTQNLEAQQEMAQSEGKEDWMIEAYENQDSPRENGSNMQSNQGEETQQGTNGQEEDVADTGDSSKEDSNETDGQETDNPDAEGETSGGEESGIENPEETQMQETSAPAAAANNYYIVQKGDTLLSISRKIYGNDRHIEEICKLNGIDDSNKIYVGEKILLPQ